MQVQQELKAERQDKARFATDAQATSSEHAQELADKDALLQEVLEAMQAEEQAKVAAEESLQKAKQRLAALDRDAAAAAAALDECQERCKDLEAERDNALVRARLPSVSLPRCWATMRSGKHFGATLQSRQRPQRTLQDMPCCYWLQAGNGHTQCLHVACMVASSLPGCHYECFRLSRVACLHPQVGSSHNALLTDRSVRMQNVAERVRKQADDAKRTADAQRRQLEADLRAANRRSNSGAMAAPMHASAADLWRSRSQQLLAAPSLDERTRQPSRHAQHAALPGPSQGAKSTQQHRETGTTDSSIIEVGYRRSASYHGGGKAGDAPLSSYQKRLAEIRAKR